MRIHANRNGALFQMNTQIPALLFGFEEAAKMLGVSLWTVRRLVLSGDIRSVNVGARKLISKDEIERIVAVGVGGRHSNASRQICTKKSGRQW
jgi:excisionase family DNA binding protein